MSQNKIAEIVGINRVHISKNMKKLQQKGLITRVGPDKGGYWKVNDIGK